MTKDNIDDRAAFDSVWNTLPDWLQLVRDRCDLIEDLLRSQPFPEVDEPPADDEELAARLDVAVVWASAIAGRVGSVHEVSTRRDGLLDLFVGAATKSYAAKVDQDWRLSIYWRPVDRERWVDCVARGGSTLCLTELGGTRLPSLERPGDVLGEVPAFLCEPVAMAFIAKLATPREISIVVDRLPRLVAKRCENWSVIRDVLISGYRIVVARSLALVAWVRERTELLIEAGWPRVELVGAPADGPWTWDVTVAGRTRTVAVTGAASLLLKDLATHESAIAMRNAKSDLVTAIPELRPWIEATRERRGHSAENRGRYSLVATIRARISVRASTR